LVVSRADTTNIAFWNELCGTIDARRLGITDNSAASLKKFDDWYLGFYPYLRHHIPFERLAGQEVLEIGLGYGTIAQKIMEADAHYYGLDIADGPIAMAQHRAKLLGRGETFSRGSGLAIPYSDDMFDLVVTIGCLHHTGDLALGLREVHRVLKAGKFAVIMVYNALSYRHWWHSPYNTYHRMKNPSFDWSNASSTIRSAYDVNQQGAAAPSTTFVSPEEIKTYLLNYFGSVRVTPRNVGHDFWPGRIMPRSLANLLFGSLVGLDLYIECIK
jgi:ubiquinone/menaquinone biosynthesis C-methylase UbiE